MIKIVTDYHASLPQDIVDEFGITLIPAYVTFGGETLQEGTDFTIGEFFERLVASPELPFTSPPAPEEFVALYEHLLADDPQTAILSLHISGEMSETVASAEQAAASLPDAAIHVFDSRAAGVAEGLLAREAAVLAMSGAGMDTILERLAHMRDTVRFFFVLDTLEYLAEGGRIGRATYLVGTTIKLKPMLTLQDGEVTGYARFTGRDKAISNLKSLVLDVTGGRAGVHLAITHSRCPDDAEQFVADLGDEVQPEVLFIGEIGPALGVHTGPGVLGAAWYLSE